VVEVVFSSPLKKDPLTPAPDPDSSIRNGTSTPLTMMVASQRPLRACARAGAGTVTSARSATTNRIDDLVLMQKLPETQKSPGGVCLPGLHAAGPCASPSLLTRASPLRSQRRAGRRGLRPDNTSSGDSGSRSCLHIYRREAPGSQIPPPPG